MIGKWAQNDLKGANYQKKIKIILFFKTKVV